METLQREAKIVNKYGLHARPAMQLVDVASRFDSEIRVSNGQKEFDAKSIMQVMQLAATQGTTLTFCADGADAQEALDALAELIAGGFGED